MTGRARRRRISGPARVAAGALATLAVLAALPAVALGHPLGNFTINHFAALRIAPDHVAIDVVIDRAEIPAFQELQRLGLDAEGAPPPAAMLAAEAEAACRALASDLRLAVAGRAVEPTLVAAGLALPPGAGGLPTMRLVCQYEAVPPTSIVTATAVEFEDRSSPERIGWREIVVVGDGLLVDGAPATDGAGVSARLTQYPEDLLARPLDVRAVAVSVAAGGPELGSWKAPDAVPLAGPGKGGGLDPAPGAVRVPGGVTEDLAVLVGVADITPFALLVSLAIAFGLGVVHALSPGHGKTIMAAYLVGNGGSSRQAIALGMTVTVAHTLGVLVLAAITVAAAGVLPPERLYPVLSVVAGGLVIAIGASLLWSRLRAIWRQREHVRDHRAGRDHHHGHHDHDHDGHAHHHGPVRAGDGVSWRGLLALGLSGGLVPSASALILLLGSIAAGRIAYGLVLVVGFGAGMAVVLTGIGLVLVHARSLLERRPPAARLRRIAAPVQLATASLVVVLGFILTGEALAQVL